jgi:predicted kinase
MPPHVAVPKPGPCPGKKTPSLLAPVKKAAKKAVAKKKAAPSKPAPPPAPTAPGKDFARRFAAAASPTETGNISIASSYDLDEFYDDEFSPGNGGGLISGIPVQDVTDAIFDYKDSQFAMLNLALRLGFDMDPESAQVLRGLDAVMPHGFVGTDLGVYRGVEGPRMFGPAWSRNGDMTGTEWQDPGYVSTSGSLEVASKFGNAPEGDLVVLRVVVPRGARGIGMQTGAAKDDEEELLLDRNSRFRVVADHGYDSKNIRNLDVEVVVPATTTGTGGAPAQNGRAPLTEAEATQRAKRIENALEQAAGAGISGMTVPPRTGVFWQDRADINQEIARDIYARYAGVPNERRAVLTAGLIGAGKTTALADAADLTQYAVISADDVKEEIARRGLIPAIPGHEDLSPMERASLVQEDSLNIAELIGDMAVRDGKNLVWDATMNNADVTQDRLDWLHGRGYNDIQGVLVQVPLPVSQARARARWLDGTRRWLDGDGLGGRYVPSQVTGRQKPDGPKRTFDKLKSQFSDWHEYDAGGDTPRPQLVRSKKGNR